MYIRMLSCGVCKRWVIALFLRDMNIDAGMREAFMRLAMDQAQLAIESGNPPFGAILADEDGNVVAAAYNTQNSDTDPTAHAEINVLRKAGGILGTRHLDNFCIVVNAESCPMCMSAAIQSRITHFYFGAPHEPRLDPDITAQDVARRAKSHIYMERGILQEACEAQIRRGREVIESHV